VVQNGRAQLGVVASLWSSGFRAISGCACRESFTVGCYGGRVFAFGSPKDNAVVPMGNKSMTTESIACLRQTTASSIMFGPPSDGVPHEIPLPTGIGNPVRILAGSRGSMLVHTSTGAAVVWGDHAGPEHGPGKSHWPHLVGFKMATQQPTISRQWMLSLASAKSRSNFNKDALKTHVHQLVSAFPIMLVMQGLDDGFDMVYAPTRVRGKILARQVNLVGMGTAGGTRSLGYLRARGIAAVPPEALEEAKVHVSGSHASQDQAMQPSQATE